MSKEEIFEFIRKNPVFYLATADGEQPHVRGMLLYSADENGIIFHTSCEKDIYKQAINNPKAELCFFGNGLQIRISGVLELIEDEALKREIYNHPTRAFLREWGNEEELCKMLAVFKLVKGVALKWRIEENFSPKEPIELF